MKPTDPKALDLLERLEAKLPLMIEFFEDATLLQAAFEIEADDIRASTTEAERAYVEGRLNCMLKNAHLIPGEDEGEPYH